MTIKTSRSSLHLTAAVHVMLMSTAAVAQSGAEQQTAAGEAEPMLETIQVTARRLSEDIERVPVSVEVISANELAKANITTEADLRLNAPGLLVRTGATSNEVNYAIRGQSLDQYSDTRPGVLPYINEVQISSGTGGGSAATAFYDLDSIQVLKGPQGTLFGRNTTGGAVLFTTARPTDHFEGYVSGLYGDYSTSQFQGALNVPLVEDRVLLRFAAFHGHQNGFQDNLYYDTHPGAGTKNAGRISLTLEPVPGLSNALVLDYYHQDASNTLPVLYNLAVLPGAFPAPFLYSPLNPGYPAIPIPGLMSWPQYLATHTNPQINSGGLASYLAQQQSRGPFRLAADDPTNRSEVRNLFVSNTTTYELSTNARLKNIFGYAHLKSVLAADSDGSPFGVAGNGGAGPQTGVHPETRILSDEVQLQGQSGHLNYTTGLYFSQEKTSLFRLSNFFDILGGAVQTNDNHTKSSTYAVYGQGTYDLSAVTGIEGLGVTAGLRYNSEHVERDILPPDSYYPTAGLAGYAYDQSKTLNTPSWTVGLQEQLNSDLLIYGVTRRSSRAGGFNSTLPPKYGYADTAGDEYRTERLSDVELGLKYQGSPGGLPTRGNLAVYNSWISDSQRTAFATVNGGPAAITANVPKTQVTGIELDGEARVTKWVNLGASLNYMDARITDGNTFVAGAPKVFLTVPDAPRWSGTFYGEVTIPMNSRFNVSVRGDLYSQSSTWFTSTGNINTGAELPGYSVTNFRVGLESAQGDWSVTANLKNAFNRTYYVGGIALAELVGFNSALPGAPRVFTIEARYSF